MCIYDIFFFFSFVCVWSLQLFIYCTYYINRNVGSNKIDSPLRDSGRCPGIKLHLKSFVRISLDYSFIHSIVYRATDDIFSLPHRLVVSRSITRRRRRGRRVSFSDRSIAQPSSRISRRHSSIFHGQNKQQSREQHDRVLLWLSGFSVDYSVVELTREAAIYSRRVSFVEARRGARLWP